MVWIPTYEYILALFKDHIKNEDIMNRQGLISSLDKVRWGIPYQDLPTIWDQVAILYEDIIENHYFSDGNKRIGVLIAYIFLHKNNYEFSPPSGEILNFTLEVAQGLKKFEQVKDWFKNHSKKIEK
jgi:death-on-curing family protein